MKITNIIKRIQIKTPIKLLIVLTCILIAVLMCYLFSIIYIKLTDPIEIPQHIFAIKDQTFLESQDSHLKKGVLTYTAPSFPTHRKAKIAAFDRSN